MRLYVKKCPYSFNSLFLPTPTYTCILCLTEHTCVFNREKKKATARCLCLVPPLLLQITLLCPPLAPSDSSVGPPPLSCRLLCRVAPLFPADSSVLSRFLWQQLISREIKRNRRETSACLLFPDIISYGRLGRSDTYKIVSRSGWLLYNVYGAVTCGSLVSTETFESISLLVPLLNKRGADLLSAPVVVQPAVSAFWLHRCAVDTCTLSGSSRRLCT